MHFTFQAVTSSAAAWLENFSVRPGHFTHTGPLGTVYNVARQAHADMAEVLATPLSPVSQAFPPHYSGSIVVWC